MRSRASTTDDITTSRPATAASNSRGCGGHGMDPAKQSPFRKPETLETLETLGINGYAMGHQSPGGGQRTYMSIVSFIIIIYLLFIIETARRLPVLRAPGDLVCYATFGGVISRDQRHSKVHQDVIGYATQHANSQVVSFGPSLILPSPPNPFCSPFSSPLFLQVIPWHQSSWLL